MPPTIEILEQKGCHFLWIGSELWMWDTKPEQKSQQVIAESAYGRVLVAGYGLGLVQHMLKENPAVDSILTVELFAGVIEENLRVFGQIHGDVEVGDFFEYEPQELFDCVIGDVWEDVVPWALKEYVRFKEKAAQLVKPGTGIILGWEQGYFEYLLAKDEVT